MAVYELCICYWKQKTAYEMRIRDGGSDVCSSDLMLVAMGLLAYGDGSQVLAMAAAGLLLVAGIGWLDDHRPLTPWSRLAVHAVASCLLGIVAIGAGGQFASALFAFVLAMVLVRSEEHTSELQSLMRISYAVFCLKKKK